ncbi:YesL family protein [Salinithrix halophila]|uniref:YesL family protein n=1 Tax=Salinithrix halophila TaxID=1485204 RepID=A0ABV8JAA5_9BACL
MEAGGWGKVYGICGQVVSLCWLNLLWIALTVAGLGVFGLFPATGAMFSVVRSILTGRERGSLAAHFWLEYRRHFLRLNGLGFLLGLMGFALLLDYRLLTLVEGGLHFLLALLLAGVTVVFSISLFYFFPVFVHYNLRFWQYLFQPFLFTLSRPGEGLLMLGGAAVLIYGVKAFPGLIPFFGGSVFAWFWMVVSLRAFRAVENRGFALGKEEGI